jgi:hypothetical protein
LTLTHSLGVAPSQCFIYLHNVTAEQNYSIGDEPEAMSGGFDTTNNRGTAIWMDATNVNVRFGSLNPFVVVNKTTGVLSTITITDWKAVFRCYLNN